MFSLRGAFLLAVIAALELPVLARAACNAIPGVETLSVSSSAPAGAVTPETTLAHVGYKGALGRIDRVYLLPGRAKTMVIFPDGICVGADAGHTVVGPPPLAAVEDVVVLISFQSSDQKRSVVRAYASAATCQTIERSAHELHGTPLELMHSCSNSGVKIDVGPQRVTVPLPEPKEITDVFGSGGASPAVRVVLAPSTHVDAALSAIAAQQPCRQQCGGLVEKGLAACLDEIFALSISPNGQATYSPDPVPCNVQIPTGLQPNDFAKACENADATLPACQPPASLPDVKMWQDTCGGVHVPFDWQNIRTQPNGIRTVSGRSGIGRKKSAENPRIWVPGREFLGSTPIADPQGTAPGVSWRKPLVDIWNDAASPQEFGLQGTADQNDSIVHIFPQVRTDLACSGTQGAIACMGIEQDAGTGGYRTCACLDRGDPGCSCDTLATARYFVCGSGDRNGMPCTRDRHCNPNGRCNGKPHCQEPGAVWTGQADDSGKECTVNDDCATESTKTQCGYRLFNLQDAIENPPNTGITVLNAKIIPAGPRRRRGACKMGAAACSNAPTGPPACAQGDCRGYQLIAGGSP